jgi:hypothetical protein
LATVGLAALVLCVPAAWGDSPSLSFSPSSSDYGTLDSVSGAPVSKTFVLTNSGGSSTGSTLAVSLSGSSSFSKTADTCTGTTLARKKSCSVTVQYDPPDARFEQTENATLTASSKKPAPLATASLTGTAGAPELTLSPGSFDSTSGRYFYFWIPLAPATQTFTITNDGAGTVKDLFIIDESLSPQFALGNDNCFHVTLAPNGACSFDITCAPVDPSPGQFQIVGTTPFDFYITLIPGGTCFF